MRIIKIITMLIAVAVWFPLGLILWIPILVRTVVLFSGSIPVSMLAGNPRHSQNRTESLELATGFYLNGFRLIFVSLYSTDVHPHNPTSNPGMSRILFREFIWTTIFWGILSLIYYYFV